MASDLPKPLIEFNPASTLAPLTGSDEQRQARTAEPVSRLVAAEIRVLELLERENEFLRGQVAVKDQQIAEMLERGHETNSLINGLQRMLGPLLSAPDSGRNRPAGEP